MLEGGPASSGGDAEETEVRGGACATAAPAAAAVYLTLCASLTCLPRQKASPWEGIPVDIVGRILDQPRKHAPISAMRLVSSHWCQAVNHALREFTFYAWKMKKVGAIHNYSLLTGNKSPADRSVPTKLSPSHQSCQSSVEGLAFAQGKPVSA